MKRQIKAAAASAGVDVRLRKNAPFGISWEWDVHGLLGGQPDELTIFDIGANVGQTAKSLAEVFPSSKIYSFEPVPETFAKLQNNTARIRNVECINMALGDTAGEAVVTSDRDGRNTLLSGVPSEGSASTKVETVDGFCADRGIQRIDVLKTDTEGFETYVLKGASESLGKGVIDFIVAECDFFRRQGEPHGDFFEIHDQLAPLGFRVVSFYTGGVDSRGWVWGNVLLMREGAADVRLMLSPYEPT